MRLSRQLLRVAAAAAIAVVWIYLTYILAVVARLMSLDGEWQGWGDVLLNPYIVVPHTAVTVLLALAVRWLTRRAPTSRPTSSDRPRERRPGETA